MSYIGSTPTTQSFIAGTDYFNGTGSAVSFTMSRAVNSVNDIEVIVNNVEQIPSGYSVSGTTLTFSAAPSAGTSNVYVRYLSTTNLSLAIPAGTSATFNTVTVADGSATTPSITNDGDTNTGIFFPAADTIAFAEGGAEAMRIDSSGNVGLAATPSSWDSTFKVVEGPFGDSIAYLVSGASLQMASNAYYNAGWKYKGTGIFARYILDSTGTQPFVWFTAASGSAGGAVTQTQAMTLDSSGNLLVARTSVVNQGRISVDMLGGTNVGLSVVNTNSGNTGNFCNFARSDTTVIGAIQQNGASAVTYSTSSDYRLKEAIAPMTGALAKVALLKPCTYKWKVDGSDGQGFIAHELDEVVPGCVTGEKDAVDAEGNPAYQGIDTSFLVATLTAAIQEQQALITALTTRITALENNNATQ